MKCLYLIIFILLSIPSQAQSIFIEVENWQKILDQSAEQNKAIFFDGITSWCKPCKQMDKEVYSSKKITEFMKTNFINLKVDMETEFGKELNKLYNITVYPTLMILNGKGEIEARHVGGLMSEEEFMDWAEPLAYKNNHRSVMESKFKSGNYEAAFLQYYAFQLKESKFANGKVLDKLYAVDQVKYRSFFLENINSTQSEVLLQLKEEISEEEFKVIISQTLDRILNVDGFKPETMKIFAEKENSSSCYKLLYEYENQ